ncbi:MAG TPA: hypothetical protein VHX20_10350 [Terracidiphilus sp.]|nr:hypothetical protein [Terracidiphilus sp.]
MFATLLLGGLPLTVMAQAGSAPASIQVDLNRPVGPYTPIYRWFGYDESNYTSMQYGRELLGELHDLTPDPVYIRAHHLLTSGDGVPEPVDGYIDLDEDKPGLGLTVNEESLRRFKIIE